MGTGTQDVGGADATSPAVNVNTKYAVPTDGTTDATISIRNAINTEVTKAQANGSNYAELYFAPVTYIVNGSLVQGGSTHGNSLIPLPVITTTAQKVTLVLTSTRSAAALMHWEQTVPLASGAVFKTTLTNGTNHVTYGAASILGGPTPQQGYGLGATMVFNNMLIVIDGISIHAPDNSTYCGFDFRGMGEASIISASGIVDQIPANLTFANMGSHITNQWTFGLAMPHVDNNAVCDILSWSCEGFCYGLMASEHMTAVSVKCIYNIVGINCRSSTDGTAMVHALHIGYACVEVCDYALSFNDGSSKIRIDVLDVENINLQYIYDPSNLGYGDVEFHGKNLNISVVGAANLRVINGDLVSGHVNSPPGIPASTTALTNPFWRNAMVIITGGVVSAVAVDGTATGLAATGVTVIVPTGKTIALTYSVAPSWDWVLW